MISTRLILYSAILIFVLALVPVNNVLAQVNTAPVISPITTPQSAIANIPLTFIVSASDADADVLVYSLNDEPEGATINSNTGAFSWTPTELQAGTHTFDVFVSDGQSTVSQTISVAVDIVSPFVFVEDSFSFEGIQSIINISHTGFTNPTFTLTTTDNEAVPDWLTINGDQIISNPPFDVITSDSEFLKEFNFIVSGSDSDDSASDSFTLTVGDLNAVPVISPITTPQSAIANIPLTFIVSASDADDADVLVYSLNDEPEGATINSNTGAFSWTPTELQAGTHTFDVFVSDGQSTVSQTISVAVDIVSPFVFVEDSFSFEGIQSIINISHTGFTNPTFTLTTTDNEAVPDWLTINGDQIISNPPFDVITSDSEFLKEFNFIVSGSDSDDSASDSFTLTVGDLNAVPVISPITTPQSAIANIPLTFIVSASDADDADVLVYSLNDEPEGATINSNTGAFSWTPTELQAGTHTFDVIVSDGQSTVSQTISVAVNIIPIITSPSTSTVNTESIDISGTAEPGSTVQLLRNSNEVPGRSTTAASDGTWSFDSFTLVQGNNELTVIATDTAGNKSALSDPVTVTLDTTAPTFVSGVMQEGTGVLTVNFSETIDPSHITVNGFTISDTISSNASPPVSLAGLATAVDPGSPDTITITLTEAQRQQVIGYTGTGGNLHLDIAAGAVRDTAQNNIVASVDNEITMVVDTILPTFVSGVMQEGTGVLTVNFSETIDPSNIMVERFTISDTISSNASPPVSLAGLATAVDPGSPDTITITLTEAQRQQVIGYTGTGGNLHLDIAAGAVRDTVQNNIAASVDNEITMVVDTILPTFVSGVMQEGTGVLTVNFSETIDPSHITVNGFTISDTISSNASPPVSLAGLATAVDPGSPDTITITLTEAQRQQVIGYTGTGGNLHLDIAAGAVRDTAQNNIVASVDNEITMVVDTILPTFVSGVMQEGTGVLTVNFSETIDPSNIMVERFTISDTISSNASPPVSLAGLATAVDPGSPDTITITLTEAQRQQVIGYTGTGGNLHLDIAAGAVRDTVQNNIAASVDNEITMVVDTILPTFVFGVLQEGAGVLFVTFSETIDPSNIMVERFTITDDLESGIEARLSVSLAGATPAIIFGAPDTLTITLTEAQRQLILPYTGSLHLDIAAGAVRDTVQNNIAASEDNLIIRTNDAIPPTFVSGVMQEGTGVLTVNFSETIDPSHITVDGFTISDTISSNASPPVSLAGLATAVDPGSPDTITITLTEAQRQQVIGYTGTGGNLHLDIAAGAVRDTAQNNIVASVDNEITMVVDTILPTFVSGVMQEGTGVLTVNFSETIDPSHITVNGFTISDTISSNASPPVSLAGLATAVDPGSPDTITITLTEAQRQQVIGYTGTGGNLHLDIAAGAVRDTVQNNIAASVDNEITMVVDTILPTFVSGVMQEGTGVLTVNFSETIDPSHITVDGFTISDTISSNASPPVSLAGLATAVDPGSPDTITITLTEAQRQQVIGYTGTGGNLHLDIAAGAVRDTVQNNIAASVDNEITMVVDTILPTFVSAVVQEGTGVLSVTFSEAIDSDVTVDSFTISDTVTGNALPPVSLAGATPDIDSTSTDTLTITLTETQRQQVIAYTGTVNNNDTNLHLDIAEGAVQDTSENDVAASEDDPITSVGDTILPTFVSAVVQEGTGVLTVNFSETISPDSIIVGNFTISDTVGNSIPVSLAGTASAIDPISAHTITITLNEQQRQRVIGYTGTSDNLHLDIAEGAVQDTSENGIAASEDNPLEMVDDQIEPTFVSGVIHKVTGLLTVTFSETIDPDNITVDSFTISGTTGSSMSVSLAGAIHASPNSDTLEITVTEQQREEIISYIANSNSDDLHLDIAAGAIRDTAQNNIISSENNLITSTGTLPPPPTSSSGGSGRINVAVSEESHAEFLHKDINKSSCDSKGFGMGISLRIFSIGYDRETSTVNVELLSTCGPASVSVSTDAGVHLAALSLTSEQSPQSSANEAEKQHLVYSATINSDADSFAVTAKDKRDTFTQTITLSDDFVEKKYHHRTGYTSEQQSSLDILNAIEDDPRPIADKTVQKNTDPIPLWIKSDLKLWNGSPARDIFFFNSIDYLIDNHYIVYEDWEKSKSLQDIDTYPQWLLNDVGNYTDGNLTDMEFTELIETLIEERVIRIAK